MRRVRKKVRFTYHSPVNPNVVAEEPAEITETVVACEGLSTAQVKPATPASANDAMAAVLRGPRVRFTLARCACDAPLARLVTLERPQAEAHAETRGTQGCPTRHGRAPRRRLQAGCATSTSSSSAGSGAAWNVSTSRGAKGDRKTAARTRGAGPPLRPIGDGDGATDLRCSAEGREKTRIRCSRHCCVRRWAAARAREPAAQRPARDGRRARANPSAVLDIKRGPHRRRPAPARALPWAS